MINKILRAIETASRYFVPDDIAQAGGIEYRRAKLTVKTVFALWPWGPFFAVLFFFGFNLPMSAGLMVAGTVGVTLSLFLMRWIGSPPLAGNVLVASIFSISLPLAAMIGGLAAPSLPWLAIFPLFALLLAGKRSGLFWIVAVVVATAGFYAMTYAGYEFDQRMTPEQVDLLRLFGISGLAMVAFAVVRLKDRLQEWLIDNLRKEDVQTRAILETAPDGVIVVDTEGRIQRTNPGASDLFGAPSENLIGEPLQALLPELQWSGRQEEATGTLDGEYMAHQIDGSRFPADVSIRNYRGDHDGAVVVVRDITEQKQRELELREARDKALEASRAKSTFLANMSHELRTPLNAVIGYSEMLIEEVELARDDDGNAELSPEFLVSDLTRIQTSGNQLLALVDDVINLAKIEAGKVDVHYDVADIAEIFERVETTLRPMADSNGNELIIDVDDDLGTMRTDATKVRQILFNLGSNACKFTENGTVTLQASRDADRVVLTVSDTGIGMDEEELESVFEAFSQADTSSTRKFDGSGLGLTLIDHFTGLLGGGINVASTPGEGTTFTVWLPDESEDADADQEADDGQSDWQPPEFDEPTGLGESSQTWTSTTTEPKTGDTVLVIDDDLDVRTLLTRVLERAGFDVVVASDGQQGLELARDVEPAVITLDIMMPGMDGWEVLSQLRADPVLATTPVVLLTMVSERSRGQAAGADHYMMKPIDRSQLVEVLDEYRGGDDGEILVVEDDEPTRSLMRRTLESSGWSVATAVDGQQAMKIVAERPPEVVLLDLMMPRMDGFEFLSRIRADDGFPELPVIVVTAKELTSQDRQNLDGEVVDIVQKGAYDTDELLEQIQRLTGRVVSEADA